MTVETCVTVLRGLFSLVISESGTDVMVSYDVFLASGQKAAFS
jgi:hypothetical protein